MAGPKPEPGEDEDPREVERSILNGLAYLQMEAASAKLNRLAGSIARARQAHGRRQHKQRRRQAARRTLIEGGE